MNSLVNIPDNVSINVDVKIEPQSIMMLAIAILVVALLIILAYKNL